MGKCPECQTEDMVAIGTEKFSEKEESTNFTVDGVGWKIYTVFYCKKCNVLVLREPKKVYGA